MLANRMLKAAAGGELLEFIFEAKTTGADEDFTLPIYNGGSYNFKVVWGDGGSDSITVWDDGAKTHTYAVADTYEVHISGTITGWRFANTGDKAKVYDISQWGPLNLGNNDGYFWGCSNLTVSATDVLDLVGTTILYRLFAGCSTLTTAPSINSWDVSSVTDMNTLFWTTKFDQDISNWNISNVETMANMFQNNVFFNQDLSSWDTSSVTNINSMFQNATSFDQDLSEWNITGLTSATNMFGDVTLSTANYSALLVGWGAQDVQDGVTFSGGLSKYTGQPAIDAKAHLVAATPGGHNWTITDGGEE